MKSLRVTDAGIERMVSVILLSGVLLSGSIVLVGGIYYVIQHHGDPVDFHTFRGQPSVNRLVDQIFASALNLRAQSIIQLGILVLIATPIVRVASSLVAFGFERDRTYVVITSIVLAVLLYSLISGAVTG